MIPSHFEVAESETILGVSMFRLHFEDMVEPSDCILELPDLLIHTTNVVKKFLALCVLKL